VAPLAQPLQSDVRSPNCRARARAAAKPVPAAWQALLKPALAGPRPGLISEAGLPAVADPGAALVAAAHALGVAVLPLAGASSLLLALAASGLNGQSFAFVGYLPQESAGARAHPGARGAVAPPGQTQLMIETPYRNPAVAGRLAAHACQPADPPERELRLDAARRLDTHRLPIEQWRRSPPQVSDRMPAVFALLAA
jgi:16S rRNA (cytidine1402-2'-O)-methyltransferase